MSFETVTMYRLVCDGCGFDRELRDTGTGTVQTMNSHNNARYVAVREAE